jgi:hypothetical protein
VCVIIINKSQCQVCVCISELGRNKTELAGKKSSLRGGKNTLQAGEQVKKITRQFQIPLACWRVIIHTPVCAIKVFNQSINQRFKALTSSSTNLICLVIFCPKPDLPVFLKNISPCTLRPRLREYS